MYGRSEPKCPFCERAEDLMEAMDIEYNYVDLASNPEMMNEFKARGFRSVPQVFIDGDINTGKQIGGFEELRNFIRLSA